jgi:predicted DNA-binding transcriptional regulator YafY
MRADRLLSLLMLLQTRGRMTAARLADELEVSERTVYRDLYALRVAGFPVYTERGPGGGCRLEETFRSRLTGLNASETEALFMTSIPAPLVELGVAPSLKGALLKLAAALPVGREAAQERVRQRIHLDPLPWSYAAQPIPHLATLHRAAFDDSLVDVTFQRIHRIRSDQQIAPYGLVAKATTWHVVWAGQDGRIRVDRVDRVLEARITRTRFDRPPDFDLPAFWQAWCRQHGANRPRYVVTLWADDAVAGLAGERWGDASETIEGASGDGRQLLRVSFPSLEEARAQLLALGGAVEVIEPRALRLTLADFARQSLRRHHETGGTDDA